MHVPDLSAKAKAFVIDELSREAKGSAICTKISVKLIELRRQETKREMSNFLENVTLPKKLSELYIWFLSRCTGNDFENHELACTALNLLSVNRRPLSILELAWAVILTAAHNVTAAGALGEMVDHPRIMGLIRPFISFVDFNDVKKHQVQLVHQIREGVRHRKWISKQL